VCAGLTKAWEKSEAFDDSQSVATDEFSTDAMTRVMSAFEDRNRDALLSQADAEG
jgi:hypothetical protein